MANYLLIESSSGFIKNIISWDGTIDQWDTSSGFVLQEATSSFTVTLGPDSNFYREVSEVVDLYQIPYTGSFTGSFTGSLQGTASYTDTASYVSSIKSGRIVIAEWGLETIGGNYTASVSFNSNYGDTSYSVSLTCGADMRMLSVTNKQTSGFTVNSNSTSVMTDDVYWVTIPYNNP